jgi:hypothetical protein
MKVAGAARRTRSPFCIESEITIEERNREKMRTSEEMHYQQRDELP